MFKFPRFKEKITYGFQERTKLIELIVVSVIVFLGYFAIGSAIYCACRFYLN